MVLGPDAASALRPVSLETAGVTVCMALLIAQLSRLLPSLPPRWRTAAMAAAMALLIIPNLSHLHSKQLVDVDPDFWPPSSWPFADRDHHHVGSHRRGDLVEVLGRSSPT
jgi:hypothetical protein